MSVFGVAVAEVSVGQFSPSPRCFVIVGWESNAYQSSLCMFVTRTLLPTRTVIWSYIAGRGCQIRGTGRTARGGVCGT